MKLNAGMNIGDYRLVSLLGGGSGSDVWVAIDRRNDTLVAVKIFKSASPGTEYETAAKFCHPCIVHPLDFLETDGTSLMVMPCYTSRSIEALAGFMRERQAWMLLKDIGSALASIHGSGYCHANVQPSNILWSGEHFLLADFGNCRSIGSKERTENDSSSYRFSAPERDKTDMSDIWSLGASVFFLVLGCPVFGGLGGRAQHPGSPVPCMRKNMPELSSLVANCLQFDPHARPRANEIADLASSQLSAITLQRECGKLVEASGKGEDNPVDFWPEVMK